MNSQYDDKNITYQLEYNQIDILLSNYYFISSRHNQGPFLRAMCKKDIYLVSIDHCYFFENNLLKKHQLTAGKIKHVKYLVKSRELSDEFYDLAKSNIILQQIDKVKS